MNYDSVMLILSFQEDFGCPSYGDNGVIFKTSIDH
jgi:hypothetical protein